MRKSLLHGVRSDLMRPEIVDSVANLPLFINQLETT